MRWHTFCMSYIRIHLLKMDTVPLSQRCKATAKRQFILTTKSSGIPNTHLPHRQVWGTFHGTASLT